MSPRALWGVSAAILAGWWLLFGWKAAGGGLICFTIAVFYAAMLTGPAEEKVLKVFIGTMVLVTILYLVAASPPDPDTPRMCGHVQC